MFGDIQGLGRWFFAYRIRLDEVRQCILAYLCTEDRSTSNSVLLQIQPRTQILPKVLRTPCKRINPSRGIRPGNPPSYYIW